MLELCQVQIPDFGSILRMELVHGLPVGAPPARWAGWSLEIAQLVKFLPPIDAGCEHVNNTSNGMQTSTSPDY